MSSTTFSGPVTSTNGFIGSVTGNIIGNLTGNVTGNVTGNLVGNATGIDFGTVQALSGAGAVNITTAITSLTTTGNAQALTLANGGAGQLKTIVHSVDGGSAVLTPVTKVGFSTITFTNVGESATLVYSPVGWIIVALFGAASA
jgi:hypothetical protein